MAVLVSGAAAAATGRLLAGPSTAPETAIVAAAGGVATLVAVLTPRGRGIAVAGGGLILVALLVLQGAPGAVLPWLAIMAAYARFCGDCLESMGGLGARLGARAGRVFASAGRGLAGRDTWNLVASGPGRGSVA